MFFKKSVVLLLTVAVFACFSIEPTEEILLETLPDDAEVTAREFVEASYPAITFGESYECIAPDGSIIAVAFLYQKDSDTAATFEKYREVFLEFKSWMGAIHYFGEEQEELGLTRNEIRELDEHISMHEKCRAAEREMDSYVVMIVEYSKGSYFIAIEHQIPMMLNMLILRPRNIPSDANFFAYGLLGSDHSPYPAVIYKDSSGVLYTVFIDGSLMEYNDVTACLKYRPRRYPVTNPDL